LRRPLTEAQIRYAVDDVLHLPTIHAKLALELKQTHRREWANEEFRRMEVPEYYLPPTRERLYRLKGTRRLDGLGLAVLERLIEWRDHWAQARNRPLRALVRDDVLVAIARRRPKRASDLEVLRGFPQARNRKVVRELLNLIEKASQTPKEQWPEPHHSPKEIPLAKAMLDILSAVTLAICEEEKVSHELVGSAQRLREVLDYHAGLSSNRPAMLSGWREDFIGQRLLELLDGHSELHVSGWPDNPRVEIVTHLVPSP
jgi:ribonuclease D